MLPLVFAAKPQLYLHSYVLSHSMKEVEVPITYLGKARSYEERMSEFLMVSKNLEIKELSTGIDMNDQTTSNEECNEHEDTVPNQDPPQTLNEEVEYPTTPTSTKLKYACNQCDRQFTTKSNQTQHIQSAHEDVKYACIQCDYQATHTSSLTKHIQSKHEGVRYVCNECDYQATIQGNLTQHIKSVHEGVKYACSQCDYQATQQSNLAQHIKSAHEGIKYACSQCDYQGPRQANLKSHIKSKHSRE